MFRAFGQAESGTSREYGGTGLGLVISKRLVELMDGGISVESELGKGARFVFTVKVQRGKQTDAKTSGHFSLENHYQYCHSCCHRRLCASCRLKKKGRGDSRRFFGLVLY